jgi:hypothetical protein
MASPRQMALMEGLSAMAEADSFTTALRESLYSRPDRVEGGTKGHEAIDSTGAR